MSQPNEYCVVKKPTKCCRRLFVGIIIALIVVVIAGYLLRPRKYTATAYIQVRTQKPYFVFPEQQPIPHGKYVNTQFALIRSPVIMGRVFDHPAVHKIPVVQRQKEPLVWLAKGVKLQLVNNSEIATISFTDSNPQTAESIVNAVVDAFFSYHQSDNQNWHSRNLAQLQIEINRQQDEIKLIKSLIKSKKEQTDKSDDKVDTQIWEFQLQLCYKQLERLLENMVALQTESSAPSRIILIEKAHSPTKRNLWWEYFFISLFGN